MTDADFTNLAMTGGQSTAVVAQNAYHVLVPQPDTLVTLRQLHIANDLGTTQLLSIRVLSAQDIAAAGAALVDNGGFFSVADPDDPLGIYGAKLLTGNIAGLVGRSLFSLAVPAGWTWTWDIPAPYWRLMGRRRAGFAVANRNANETHRATFVGSVQPATP